MSILGAGINRYPDDMDRRGTYKYEQFNNFSTYGWRVVKLWEPEDEVKPHLCVMSAHGPAADDQQLLQSEVLALAQLALYCLNERAADNHFITPVRQQRQFLGTLFNSR
jgi:hypothetical protein